MRLIDADELLEHVYREKLDSRELIAKMIDNAPTIDDMKKIKMQQEELKAGIQHYQRENERLRGQIKALAFAVRCNGVSGNEVSYEAD